MSWSVGASGYTPEVGETIEKQFTDGYVCPEPEESTRQAARELIAKTVAAQTPGTKLQIAAYGSQLTNSTSGAVSVSIGVKIDVLT